MPLKKKFKGKKIKNQKSKNQNFYQKVKFYPAESNQSLPGFDSVGK